MKFFLAYLRTKLWVLLAFVLFMTIYFVTFALCRLPMEAVTYPAGLCVLAGILVLILDSRRAFRRHQVLARLIGAPADQMAELPLSEGPLEADYQAMVAALNEARLRMESDTERTLENMVDYYTAWVHQIKTPIASMRLTLQNEDSPASRKLSADLLRVEQYVDMVLTYLRLDAGSTDYVFRSCDLNAIVRQAVRKFAGEFIDRRISLQYTPVDAQVVTDEKWLAFIIGQVLSNALKYTPEGGSISISLEEEKVLCIRDTGIGIAAGDLPRIFEKGFTGYNGRRNRQASGIGLYLCRRICRNLGHGISAASEPGQGTAIFLDLAQKQRTME